LKGFDFEVEFKNGRINNLVTTATAQTMTRRARSAAYFILLVYFADECDFG